MKNYISTIVISILLMTCSESNEFISDEFNSNDDTLQKFTERNQSGLCHSRFGLCGDDINYFNIKNNVLNLSIPIDNPEYSPGEYIIINLSEHSDLNAILVLIRPIPRANENPNIIKIEKNLDDVIQNIKRLSNHEQLIVFTYLDDESEENVKSLFKGHLSNVSNYISARQLIRQLKGPHEPYNESNRVLLPKEVDGDVIGGS